MRDLLSHGLRPLAERRLRHRLAALARPPGGPEDLLGLRVALFGIFSNRMGLGQGAELLARQLTAQGALVDRIDVAGELGLPGNLVRTEVRPVSELRAGGHDLVIVHLNPPEFGQLRTQLAPELFQVPIIGVFLWELDRVPRDWREAIQSCDQVWTPSVFIAEAITATFPDLADRLRVRPYAVDLDPMAQRTMPARLAARTRLGVDPDTFLVLTSFSMKSTLARKNPIAAIEAFRRAFPAEVNATHLIRCLDHAAFPEGLARMQAAASGDARIRVAAIGREESSIEDAYLACDVYLSLHRSEGFGLNLAEALSMGLPVIGTRWSLGDAIADHRLFIPVPSTLVAVVDDQHLYDGVAGARWAEPDIAFAADALSRVAASAHAPDTGPSKS
ncbi:glycosyltransferase [Chelatococcus reniformis]|uniref:Glycosyl transferase n=1 Tax=Chelatococcus reniformis TaxID=1494448 RepID=A0A916X8Q2_9HYPH|nr:glycosyltransferase [Chelatococcus reniformis]GGC51403.1 glycosyl transferase [Chelatococcus reniformis]